MGEAAAGCCIIRTWEKVSLAQREELATGERGEERERARERGREREREREREAIPSLRSQRGVCSVSRKRSQLGAPASSVDLLSSFLPSFFPATQRPSIRPSVQPTCHSGQYSRTNFGHGERAAPWRWRAIKGSHARGFSVWQNVLHSTSVLIFLLRGCHLFQSGRRHFLIL